MKNFVYLGTALHMIFLANLSPCHAMEEIQFDAVDAEGKKGQFTLRVADGSVLSESAEVIHLTSVFKLTDTKMEEHKTAFGNALKSADEAINGVLKSLSSNAQKTDARSWLDKDLATGEGHIPSKFQTLIKDKNDLSVKNGNLFEETTVLQNQLKTLKEEKEKLSAELINFHETKNLLETQVQTLNREKEKLSAQFATLNKVVKQDITDIDIIVTNLADNKFKEAINILYKLEDSGSSFNGNAKAWRTKLETKEGA
jgi:chromosome segregation ATPase